MVKSFLYIFLEIEKCFWSVFHENAKSFYLFFSRKRKMFESCLVTRIVLPDLLNNF